VGAYAVAAHTRPRATGDIDLWVNASVENAGRVYRAIAVFGAPLDGIDERTFSEADIVFQIGVPPVRIDILTGIDGLTFAQAWPNRIGTKIGNVSTWVLGRGDLLTNKAASGRPKDLADIERLRCTM
jgi:hypothetical protein